MRETAVNQTIEKRGDPSKKHTVVFSKTSNVFLKTSNVFSKTSNVFFKTTVCF